MATEIERKFLLTSDDWRTMVSETHNYKQGYLAGPGRCYVRVRISDEHAWLNIKSASLTTFRYEYEYEIPKSDAEEMLARLCSPGIVSKTRYIVHHKGHVWEIDVFDGDNEGLIVAEIELNSEDEPFSHPDWLGAEVTDDKRYYNVYLAQHPYQSW